MKISEKYALIDVFHAGNSYVNIQTRFTVC